MLPLDTREWLEAMYRAGGPDADRAAQALAELDAVLDDADELELWRQLDVDDVKDARLRLKEQENARKWCEKDLIFGGLVEIDTFPLADCIEHFVYQQYSPMLEFREAVQDLAIAAGLLAPGDRDTDPLPLIRMFLPV